MAETAAKHFAGAADLVLVAVDADALGGALKWEPSRGGALFPHLYGALPLAAVRWVKPLAARRRRPPRLSGACAVITLFESWARPLLRLLDPEDAHRLAILALKIPPLVRLLPDDPRLAVRAFGLNFPNPVGMAAGFDKHAEVPDALLRLGFGFVEIGTVTPQPQAGNPRPRLFRLDADEGVINRLGFNSEGAEAVLRRLAARANAGGIVGVNIGANKDAADRIADYVRLIETFAPVASYFTVNISSPNTPGLRDLQQGKALDDLLARVMDARARMSRQAGDDAGAGQDRARPHAHRARRLVGAARRHRVDGMIVGNTTLARPPSLRDRRAQRGGRALGRAAVCARRRACWRRPMCGSRARSRSSAWAASIRARPRSPRSGPGRA